MATTGQAVRSVLSVVSLIVALQVCSSANSCNVPSTFWCDSEETANACGVLAQCQKYEWPLRITPDAVNLTLYYESLCPYSKNFIITQLYPTYQKIPALINLNLVPYGNANEKQVGSQWNYTCQHGAEECVGNLISTCAINIVKDVSKYFPFLYCIENSNQVPRLLVQQCSRAYPVPLNDILNCTSSELGNSLEHQMALQTGALVPRHTYVPWITVNGAHTDSIQQQAQSNLLKLICDTYKGTKPSACPQVLRRVTLA